MRQQLLALHLPLHPVWAQGKSIPLAFVSSCWRFICLCILCGNKEKAFRLLVHLGCIVEAAVCILCGNKEKASLEQATPLDEYVQHHGWHSFVRHFLNRMVST
jgi:hypothetical protein